MHQLYKIFYVDFRIISTAVSKDTSKKVMLLFPWRAHKVIHVFFMSNSILGVNVRYAL